MSDLNNILNCFNKINLNELNAVKLMNRTDTKFVLSVNKLPIFLKKLSSDFKILSIENKFSLSYATVYYDTSDFIMYFKHHNKVLNRYKIRHRNYLETNTGFLELKFKNNKGRTIKTRLVKNDVKENWNLAEQEFINLNTPYKAESLLPKVLVKFNRLTFLNNNLKEKITIDLNLEFSNEESHQRIDELAIIELKQSDNAKNSGFHILRNLKIKPLSISKYCLGVNFLYPYLKKNNFKEKLVTLNKIINDTSYHISNI